MLTLIQVRPSNPIWDGLAPLVRQVEALGRVMEVCVTYYSWLAGCAAGVALLLLTGLVLQEARDGGSADGRHEDTTGASEPRRARGAEHFKGG